ncbi:T9SS sorting signal type C domain-containing protein [Flavobacterium sp. JAS]|uniref:T9SS sorting signal type C domain-containing protein n=1 Tax=Flavobacterium sp. JAS TaxID=2897329 RepID=UPI001E60D73C|nr:T9SS sorting signal type C domain-containing protein [Flavobacterium sp. JAS]MCD0470039.1 T9SS sorting signal type C domain-containing protein [Flavobacterium sp. JAS]
MIRKLLTNKKLLLSLLLFFTFLLNYGQSASSYCFSARSGTYPILSGTTNVPGLNATDDEGVSTAITLPFNFTFGGSAYNQVKVSSNGWLTFGSTTNAAYINTLANAGTSKPILFPLWDDLQNRAIPRYVVTGSAPNRVFKLEWSQQEWNYNANNDVISFQVWLFENGNVIEYYYNRGATAINNGTASIGIYDSNDTYLTLNNSTSTPIAQSTTFTTNIGADGVKPANGQVYSFSPPAPVSQAGADQYKNTPFTLAANAPGSGNTGTWSIVSGPNLATSQFASGDTSNPTSTFTPSGSGTWVLRWTISNGSGCSTTDDVVVSNCSGNLITNGDFTGGATGWTAAVNSKGPVSGTSYVEVLNEKIYFNNNNDDNTAELDSQASLGQTVAVIPNVQYTLNFLYARRPGSPATVAVDVRVYEGGSITASKNITTSDTNNTPQVGTLTFTPTSSSIVLEFFNSLGGTSTLGSIVDNIVLIPSTQVVPIAITNPKGSYKTLTVCVGASVGLDVDNISASGVSYSWSTPSSGTSFTTGTNIKSPSVTFTTTGMKEFKVLATNSSGCGNVYSSTFVYVIDLPVVYNVTGGGPYCSGGTGAVVGLDGSTAVSSTSNISYQLQRGGVDVAGAVVTGTGAAISFGPQTVAGTYTVVAKNTLVSTACSSNMNGAATVSISTPPTVSITGTNNICVGTKTTLSSSGVGNWASNNTAVASVNATTGEVTGVSAGTATFTFTNTAAPNCSATTAVVTVSSSTIVFDSSGSYTIPAGVTNIQVECWGAGGGGGAASVDPSAGGGGAGGGYVKNTVISVTPNSTYTVNVGTGGIVSTSASGGKGGSSWFGSTTTILAVGGNGGVLGNGTTPNGAGGVVTTTGNVGGTAISAYALVGGSAGGSGAARIAGSGSAGAGSNGGAGAVGTTTNGKGADGTAPGGGGAGGRNRNSTNSSGGVGGMGRVTITLPTPTASAGGSQTICQTGTAIVSGASATNGTILWSHDGSGSLSNATTLTPTYAAASGDAGKIVTLLMTVSNGPCLVATATYTVNVTPTVGTPTAVSPATTTICQGSANTTYTTSATNATSYTWTVSGIGNTISGTGTTGTVTWATGFSGQATIGVTANGCGTSSIVSTTVDVTPTVGTPTAITPSATTICQGSANTTYTTSATNATSYTWTVSGIGNTISGTGTTGTVTWAAGFSGQATISVKANGCSTSSAVSTTVDVTPTVGTPTAITPSATTICQGSANTTYTTSATNATSYIWTVSGIGNAISGTGTTGTVTWAAGFSGQATISVKANSCGTSSAISTTVNVNPLQSTPITGTPTQPTCASSSGIIPLSNLPSTGTWTITQGGSFPGITYTGTGSTYDVKNLAAGNYTFIVQGDANTCNSLASANVVINASSSIVWKGSKDGNWSDPANWSSGTIPTASDCVVIPNVLAPNSAPTVQGTGVIANAYVINVSNSGSLTVNSRNTLKVVGSVIVATSGSLVFKDKASLVQTTNAINTGNITYLRDTKPVRRYDFTYWSTPITNSTQPYTLHDLSPDTLADKYATYNPLTGSWVYSFNGTQVMAPAVGYWVRAPQPYSTTISWVYTATFTGVPNNGDYPVQVSPAKWNLIGNPYPSAIDAEEFITKNHDAMPSVDVGALYFWTHNSPPVATGTGSYAYVSSDFAVFSLSGIVSAGAKRPDGATDPAPTGEIAACQGFFMKASGPNDVMFTNGMRIDSGNDQFYKTSKSNTIEKNRIWLNLTNTEGAFKQALVGYIEGATNSWDVNYDATTISGNSFIDFYSINEANKLTIQGRALPFTDTDKIPLGYKTTVAGDFTIAIDHVDGLFNNQAVYLEDKTTGIVTDLRAGNYTFTTAIGTFIDRFALSYTKKTLGTGDFENLENSVFVSIKEKTIKVTSTKETIKEVTIYDISGNLLYNKKKIGSAELQIPNLQSSNQVLLVKVTLENDYTTTKKVIFQ